MLSCNGRPSIPIMLLSFYICLFQCSNKQFIFLEFLDGENEDFGAVIGLFYMGRNDFATSQNPALKTTNYFANLKILK